MTIDSAIIRERIRRIFALLFEVNLVSDPDIPPKDALRL